MFKLDDYYKEKEVGKKVGSESFNFVSELLRNAYCHGGGNKNGVNLGLFLSLDYFVLGCCDGGDYFKDLDIKRKWERKCHIKTMGMKFDSFGKFICGKNVGTNVIYSCTDKIFIDNESGTFYGRLNPKKYAL